MTAGFIILGGTFCNSEIDATKGGLIYFDENSSRRYCHQKLQCGRD